MTKNVLIFTTFYEVKSGYSLVSVVETQIKMLLDNGYNPVVLVDERFQPTKKELWQFSMIDLRPVVPRLDKPEGLYERTREILREHLRGIDVVLTHDLILHSFYSDYDKVIREYAGSDILWLHWIHSRPSRQCTPPPGYIIYPNATEKSLVCQCYGLREQEYRVQANRASHAISPLEWYSPLTNDLVKASGFLDGDFSMIYPRGADPGKQGKKIIYLLAGIRQAGYEPRLLIVDWQSQGERFQAYMDECELLAEELGVLNCIKFTSRLDDRCSQGIPRENVLELMDLSNLYIHPSNGETYGLTIHEAMLRGCLCILNHDFAPMRELFGENAIYMDFGSSTTRREYQPNEAKFWTDEAKRLIVEYKRNRALVAKSTALRQWTPQTMWGEFEQLFYLESA